MTEAFVYGVVTQSEDVGKLGFVRGCVGCIFAVTAPMLVKRYQTVNGMTEAFVYGVVTQSEDVGKLGFVHGCVGCIFAVTAPMLVKRYQTVGLFIANGLSMILRSAYLLVFAAGRKTFCLNHFFFWIRIFMFVFARNNLLFFQIPPYNFILFLKFT